MATTNKGKRRQLLTDAQYDALYGVPAFSPEEQDHYFSLNDLEQEAFDSFRVPGIQVYFVLLLGYTRHSNVMRDIEWDACKADIAAPIASAATIARRGPIRSTISPAVVPKIRWCGRGDSNPHSG